MLVTMNKVELHIDITEPTKAIEVLLHGVQNHEGFDLSKQKLKIAMSKGAVWLTVGKKTQRLRRASKILQPGQVLHLYYDPQVLDSTVEPPQLLADCQGYSLWYKPCGMLSQGSKWSDHCTITRFAEQNLSPERNAFIVHRLDRAATGLILVGHSKRVTAQLCELFQQRSLEKYYLVIVHGRFGHFEERRSINEPIDGKQALSHAELKAYDAELDRSLVEVKIETGRKHQIRRHMAGCGHPVVGDRLYGTGCDIEDLQLTAYRLSFCCPLENQAVEHILPQSLWPTLCL
jgi:tRNA pseudouridine32 synthase/23S rRNA pseudouridine746 synthase